MTKLVAVLSCTIVLVLSSLLLLASQVWGLRRDLGETHGNKKEIIVMETDTKTASWEDIDCTTREVKTARRMGESDLDFCTRHDETVAHDQQAYGIKEGNSSKWLETFLRHNKHAILDNPLR